MSRTVVIGIGNPDRGDDAVGRLVARRLAGRVPPGVRVIEHDGEATALIEELSGAEAAILIDAARMDGAPGSIRRIDAGTDALPAAATASTHGFGLAAAIDLGRALGVLPERCIVVAVAASGFEIGMPPAPPVAAAVELVADLVLAELAAWAVPESVNA